MQPKLGILAGGGKLPANIIDICQRSGRAFYVVAFDGQADEDLCRDIPHSRIRLGAGGKTLKALRDNDVDDIIFVGSIKRPGMAQLRPDAWGLKFLARSGALALGDDGFLSILVKTLEQEEGFRVVGIGDVAAELLAPVGAIGSLNPGEADQVDIEQAVIAALGLGEKDIGQAAVVRKGEIIGLEGSAGTDDLLRQVGELSVQDQAAGVLAKVAKPQQERRADLPTIGVETVENAARAGLAGIVVEAGASIILDKDKVAEVADELRLFVMGIRTKDLTGHG